MIWQNLISMGGEKDMGFNRSPKQEKRKKKVSKLVWGKI